MAQPAAPSESDIKQAISAAMGSMGTPLSEEEMAEVMDIAEVSLLIGATVPIEEGLDKWVQSAQQAVTHLKAKQRQAEQLKEKKVWEETARKAHEDMAKTIKAGATAEEAA